MVDCYACTGGSLSEACDKSVLSAALSMVLAFLLLELRHDLREHRLLLHPESPRLNLGEHEEARPSKDAQRMKKSRPGLIKAIMLLSCCYFLLLGWLASCACA